MISNPRHGSPPRLMAHQPTRCSTTQEPQSESIARSLYDVLAGAPVEDFRATVQSTIRWLKDHGIDTALIGLQYSPAVEKDERHKAIGQVIREVASAENVLLVLLVRRYDAMEFLANFKLEELLSD